MQFKKMGCQTCKYPIFITLFLIYILAAILAIATGGFLISESMGVEKNGDQSDAAKKDVKYMEEASVWIGGVSIVFSLVFIWDAVELGVILCCGRKLEDSCFCEKIVKEEMRTLLSENV